MHCQNCSQELIEGAAFCGNCGAKILNATTTSAQPATPAPQPVVTPPAQPTPTPAPAPLAQPTPLIQPAPGPALAAPIQNSTIQPQPAGVTGTYAVAGPAPNSILPTLSLIAGIISLGSFFFWPLAVLLGITAVILGIIGLTKKVHKGLSITGIVLGSVGVILSIIFVIAVFSYCEKNPLEESCIELTASQML